MTSNEQGEEEVSLSSSKCIVHSTNTLEQVLVFLKGMVNEHVHNIVQIHNNVLWE